jgi:hypothetical protein
VYAVLLTKRKLRHYFDAHPITVVSKYPLGEVIQNPEAEGRMAKWALELMGQNISYSPVAWAYRPGEAGSSAPRRCQGHMALCESGSPADLFGWGGPQTASSSPRLSRERRALTATMRSLPPLGVARAWTTPTCRSNQPRRWACLHSTPVPVTDLHRRTHPLPRLTPRNAVIIPNALANL